jgi:hypothetical protein
MNANNVVMLILNIEFSRRQAGEVAHTLARDASFFTNPHIFIDVARCVETLIFNEMHEFISLIKVILIATRSCISQTKFYVKSIDACFDFFGMSWSS